MIILLTAADHQVFAETCRITKILKSFLIWLLGFPHRFHASLQTLASLAIMQTT